MNRNFKSITISAHFRPRFSVFSVTPQTAMETKTYKLIPHMIGTLSKCLFSKKIETANAYFLKLDALEKCHLSHEERTNVSHKCFPSVCTTRIPTSR